MTLLCVAFVSFGTMNAVPISGGKKLYFTPNDNWISQTGSWYAICFQDPGESWVKLTPVAGKSEVYEATVPTTGSFNKFFFLRMKSTDTSTLNWTNFWNQANIYNYDGSSDYFTMKDGIWDGSDNSIGTWSSIPVLSWIGLSFIYIGDSPEAATWYNVSGSGNELDFDGANLGEITTLKLGAEVQTYQIVDGVTVFLNYMINGDGENIQTIEIPWKSNSGSNSMWQSTAGTDVIGALTPGDYTIDVWFSATDGENTVYDSKGFGNNYVVSFTIPIVSGIPEVKDNSVSISIETGAISASFEGSAAIELYTVSGVLLKKIVAEGSFEQTGLASGLYIVKINGKVSKVLVK